MILLAVIGLVVAAYIAFVVYTIQHITHLEY